MGNKEKFLFKHGKKITVAAILIFLPMTIIFLLMIPKTNDTGSTGKFEPELSLAADKEIYHSSEEMSLNAGIMLEKEANVTLRLYGIPDSRGNYRVMEERNISIGQYGMNETFVFNMPSCYGCAGVSPGEYEIVMEAWHNDEMVGNCSKTVTLEK
jgi:hypothetical protein